MGLTSRRSQAYSLRLPRSWSWNLARSRRAWLVEFRRRGNPRLSRADAWPKYRPATSVGRVRGYSISHEPPGPGRTSVPWFGSGLCPRSVGQRQLLAHELLAQISAIDDDPRKCSPVFRPASAGSVCRRSGLGAEVQRLWPRGARGPPSAGRSWQAEHRATRGSGSVAWRDLHRYRPSAAEGRVFLSFIPRPALPSRAPVPLQRLSPRRRLLIPARSGMRT
jgi:hypothetical protein